MADDLRERIRGGDLDALLDPALPLHLLTEPDADWWQRGLWFCGASLVFVLGDHAPRKRAAEALVSWAKEMGVDTTSLRREAAEMVRLPIGEFAPALREKCLDIARYLPRNGPHPLTFARRLRPMVPGVLPEVDDALAVLARHGG